MEYAKDIILDINIKRKEVAGGLGHWTSKKRETIRKIWKKNKFIITILLSLLILISVDIALVNTFFYLLASL